MNDLQPQFSDGLETARSQLHRARVRVATSQGLDRAVISSAIALAAASVAAIGIRLTGSSLTSGHYAVAAGVVGVALLAPLLSRLLPALRRRPTLDETAERLDLATANHNRIASALELVGRPDVSPFARAAVQQGLETMNWVRAHRPTVPVARWRWRRNAASAGVGMAAVLIAILLPINAFSRSTGAPQIAAITTQSGALADPNPPQETPRPAEQARREQAVTGTRKPASAADKSTSARSGGTAMSSTPNQAAAGTASTAQQQSPEAPKPTEPRKTPAQEETDTPAAAATAASTALRQSPPSDARGTNAKSASGGKGSSAQPTLGLEGDKQQSRENAREGSNDAESEEEVIADANAESEHRGGMRPVLQDRSQSPTRELGMSGSNKGPPGNGRGGPTPPKKSRGAGSLLLGVPIPDFIQGRLLPGISRLSRQLIPPQRQPGDPAAAADTAARSANEPAVDRFNIPAESRDAVERYFTALHRDPDSDNPASAGIGTGATPTPEIAP